MRGAASARSGARPRVLRCPMGGQSLSSVGRRMVWAVRVERQARSGRRAIASISMRAPLGRAPTANVERAGAGSGMNVA